MIYLYHGTPGSGKSYHAASKIRDLLRANLHRSGMKQGKYNVISNFPVDTGTVFLTWLGWKKTMLTSKFGWKFKKYNRKPDSEDHFFCWENNEMTIDRLKEFCEEHHKYTTMTVDGVEQRRYYEGQTYVVIDECQILFNCRDFGDKGRREWCQFFSQHRHYGFDFILLCQHERMLDRQIRYLIEIYVDHRNAKNWNTPARILSALLGGSMFIARTRWQGCKEIMSVDLCRYSERIASTYNSYLIFTPRA